MLVHQQYKNLKVSGLGGTPPEMPTKRKKTNSKGEAHARLDGYILVDREFCKRKFEHDAP